MKQTKQTPSWAPLAAAGLVGALLLGGLAIAKLTGDDAASTVLPPAEDVGATAPQTGPAPDLVACIERGAQCQGALPSVAAPAKPAAPLGYRSLRWRVAEPTSGGGLRVVLQTNPKDGVGASALVLAELGPDGGVTTLLPPVEHGERAYWRGDVAWVFAAPNQKTWTVHRFREGAWTTVGNLEPQRTAEGVAEVGSGATVVYLQADTKAVAARFDEEGAVEIVTLLPEGLPWLRTHINGAGDVVAMRSREAEDREGPPRLEVAHLGAGSSTPTVTETTIPELRFDKVGFVLEHCFDQDHLWGLIDGYILMSSHDGGRSWSRAHTYGAEQALNGVSLACKGERLVVAGNDPDSKPWGSVCTRAAGCTELAPLGSVATQWVSAQVDGRVLWRPASTPRVAVSRLADGEAKVEKVLVASGISDARKALNVLHIDGAWFPF
jgi:hypothetical protein